MEYLTQIQNEYVYFTDMLKSIEKIKKTYHTDEDEGGKDTLDIQANPNKKYHDTIYNNEVNGRTYLSIYTGNKNAVKIGKFIKKVLPRLNK